jgi:Mlc titration factor MtfA (ptsG expression regulator)
MIALEPVPRRLQDNCMLLSWWKRRRRQQILAEPFPAAWQQVLDGVAHYALVTPADQGKIRQSVQLLIAEKTWEGCRGLALTDEIRVTIAALAAVLILGLPDYYFDNVQEILVHPDEFVVKEEASLGGEAVLYGESENLGVAEHRGPVVLSWACVQAAAAKAGHGENLVFHEFAHQLDMLNGDFDGTPRIDDDKLRQRWADVMQREYQRLARAARRGRKTLLDHYGATDPAEFFAVVTECFFDASVAMSQSLPELYELLRDYYHQDPACWPGWAGATEG